MAWRLLTLILAGVGAAWAWGGGVELTNNTYSGVVVALDEDVAENPNIIPNIKRMFQEGSRVLDQATRGRAHFGQVTILLPSTWSPRPEYKRVPGVVGTAGVRAAVKVGAPHIPHGHAPYTEQMGGCGEEGETIHLTPHFVTHMYDALLDEYGAPGKVLVHEWAHYRWGVFDEYVSHPTKGTPPFYVDYHGKVRVTGCTGALRGWLGTAGGAGCHADVTGLPDAQCHFYPEEQSDGGGGGGSFMALYYLDAVTMFCDGQEVPHNTQAPTPHNQMCGKRPVWDVITQHRDFSNGKNPPRVRRTRREAIKEEEEEDMNKDKRMKEEGEKNITTEEEQEEEKEKKKEEMNTKKNENMETKKRMEKIKKEEEEEEEELGVTFEIIQLEKEEEEEEEEVKKKNMGDDTTHPDSGTEEVDGGGGGGGGGEKEEEEEEEEEERIYAPRFVLLLDLSGSMDAYMGYLTGALKSFIRYLVPEGSKMAVMSFANSTHKNVDWTVVGSAGSEGTARSRLLDLMPSTYFRDGYTAIGQAMEDTLKMVKEKGIRGEGLQLVLVTDGRETIHPVVATVLPKIKKKGITVNTISLGGDATDALESWAQQTGGQSFCYNTESLQSDLSSLLYYAITTPETRPHLSQQVHQATHTVIGRGKWDRKKRRRRRRRRRRRIEDRTEEEKEMLRRRWGREGEKEEEVRGEVILDSSLGRHTQFIFSVIHAHEQRRSFSVGAVLVDPAGSIYTAEVRRIWKEEEEEEEKKEEEEEEEEKVKIFRDSSSFSFTFRSAMPGRWRYTLTNHVFSKETVQVLVTSRPAHRTPTPPVSVQHGLTVTSVKFPDPVVVWARVTQGRSAVLEANVTALVSLPSNKGPVSLPLLDNGKGADHQAGDGVYAAYFTQFAGDGRYGLSVYASATNTTSRTHDYQPSLSSSSSSSSSSTTTTTSSSFSPSSSSSSTPAEAKGTSAVRRLPPLTGPLPPAEISFPPTDLKPPTEVKPPPPPPPEKVTKMEQFARFSSGGVFKVTNYKPGDLQPPGRVSDLAVTRVDLLQVSVTLEWTSPGDDHFTGTASHLELTYQMTRPDLHSPKRKFNVTHLTAGHLTPLPAGLLHSVTLKIPASIEEVEGRPYKFWVRAGDEMQNWAKESNTATAIFPSHAAVMKVKNEEITKSVAGLVVLVCLGLVILFLAAFTAYIKHLHARRKKRREQPLVEGGTMGREGVRERLGSARYNHNYSWEGGR